MIKSIITISLLSISATGFSQNWFNQSNSNANENNADIQVQSRGNFNSSLNYRGSRGSNPTNFQQGVSNTNKSNNRGNTNNNIGGLVQQTNMINVNISNNANVLSNTFNGSRGGNPSRGNIAQAVNTINTPVVRQQAVQVQTRSRGNSNPSPVRNVAPRNLNVPTNDDSNDNIIVQTAVQDNNRQLLNPEINFSNTRNINKEQMFEVNLVQKKEITALPKPSVDLSVNLEVRKPEINLNFSSNKSEKLSVKTSSSHTKKRKHAYYSQNSQSHFGLKVKTFIKKTFHPKRKIRMSVACPSF